MPRLSKEFKLQVKELQKEELEEIVIKMSSKEKTVYDFVTVNYLDKESGEEKLFDKAKSDLDNLLFKNYRGRVEQQQNANMIAACIKRINEFVKISKNKKYEAELLLYVLDEAFHPKDFGTCFTVYDNKIATLVKRIITLVTKKMHPDYLTDYQDEINKYLNSLHKNSNNIDAIYDMPESI